ncbi:hypothetical protein [Streptomyces sp. MK37H]|uniref:hypothetical protein n=1 Tax=Streptomyces sp. MK37H TaxID=2699117 RepID=UPI001FF9BE0A|nr:hypothetical protein [Streptomyces sp. MK37H]
MSNTTPETAQRSWFARHKLLTAIGALIVFIVVISVATGGGKDDSDSGKSDTAAAAPEEPKTEKKTDAQPAEDKPADKPQAQQFKDFVTKNGTPTEKTAVQHVTKVQGADEQNDVLDSAEVWTDYAGGMMGPHASDGKLLASAFADWRDSKNGLVTVYDAKGEILANGNF